MNISLWGAVGVISLFCIFVHLVDPSHFFGFIFTKCLIFHLLNTYALCILKPFALRNVDNHMTLTSVLGYILVFPNNLGFARNGSQLGYEIQNLAMSFSGSCSTAFSAAEELPLSPSCLPYSRMPFKKKKKNANLSGPGPSIFQQNLFSLQWVTFAKTFFPCWAIL